MKRAQHQCNTRTQSDSSVTTRNLCSSRSVLPVKVHLLCNRLCNICNSMYLDEVVGLKHASQLRVCIKILHQSCRTVFAAVLAAVSD